MMLFNEFEWTGEEAVVVCLNVLTPEKIQENHVNLSLDNR
jgi:hypothetical protein